MIDAACNYMNPYTGKFSASSASSFERISSMEDDIKPEFSTMTTPSFLQPSSAHMEYNTFYKINSEKVQTLHQPQYPPQPSSTGSASPNSSMSASTSPSIFPSPSASSSSSAQNELGSSYSWNTYTGLPARPPPPPQFPYAQYAPEYYGNMPMPATAASWFSHQDRLYQPWSSNYGLNFEDIAFQTQLQRRSVRCTCPNCTNEMSGLPPIVGPDERGRKQHICHIPGCERLYGKASHLKTHLRWHTGERPFLCLTCGKRFSRSDELQRHGRTHTNYRPYSCPICSKKFSRSDHLSKHKKTHLKDKKSKKEAAKKSEATAEAKTTATAATAAATSPVVAQAPSAVKSEPSAAISTSTATSSHSEVPSGYTPYNMYQTAPAMFSHNAPAQSYPAQHQSMGLFYNRPSETTTTSTDASSKSPHESGFNLYHSSPPSSVESSPKNLNPTETSQHGLMYDGLHGGVAAYPSMASQMKSDYPTYHDYASSGMMAHPAYPAQHPPSHGHPLPWSNFPAMA